MKIPFSSRTCQPMPITRRSDQKGDLKKKNINLWNTSQWLLMQKKKKHKKTKTKHKKTKNKTNKKTKKSKIVKNSKATL